MKYLIPIFFLVLLASCYTQKPVSAEPPRNNTTYNVEYLFEYEGCRVYRFWDRGNYIYFTNCKGEAIAKTDSTEVRNMTRKTQ